MVSLPPSAGRSPARRRHCRETGQPLSAPAMGGFRSMRMPGPPPEAGRCSDNEIDQAQSLRGRGALRADTAACVCTSGFEMRKRLSSLQPFVHARVSLFRSRGPSLNILRMARRQTAWIFSTRATSVSDILRSFPCTATDAFP